MRVAWGWLKAAAAAALLAAPGCGGAGSGDSATASPGVGAPTVWDAHRAEFDLRWRGHLAGRAIEELVPRPGGSGYRLARREQWRVARGDSIVEWEIEVVIDADSRLRGERIACYLDRRLRGSARRTAGGWIVEAAGEAPRSAPAAAEPAELIPLRVARGGPPRWSGPVLLAGFDFAAAELTVERLAGRRLRAVLAAPAGRLETRMRLAADGTIEAAEGPDVSAARAGSPRREAAPDLIALGGIPVAGARRARGAAIEIELPAPRQVPRGMPGQHVVAGPSGWRVELGGGAGAADGAWPATAIADPTPPAAVRAEADRVVADAAAIGPMDELRALARHTAERIAGDLAAGTVSAAADVLVAGRADCVGHAALFSAMARARGIDVRLVSGYRLDGGMLVRHMWAVARTGGATIVIDPTHGEAPGRPGRHLGLVAHGSAPGEIALATELAFAGLSGARARFVAR